MKTILQKAIRRTAVLIKHLFAVHPKQQERKPILAITRFKPHELYTGKIFTVLKASPGFPVPPIYRSDLKMVHRRLVQYQRLRWHGSLAARQAALKKLEKEWRKFMRDNGQLAIGNKQLTISKQPFDKLTASQRTND